MLLIDKAAGKLDQCVSQLYSSHLKQVCITLQSGCSEGLAVDMPEIAMLQRNTISGHACRQTLGLNCATSWQEVKAGWHSAYSLTGGEVGHQIKEVPRRRCSQVSGAPLELLKPMMI